MSAAARSALCRHLAFCLPPGRADAGLPGAGRRRGDQPGRRRYNWVWYRPVEAEHLPALLIDADGRRYDMSIPPARMARRPIDEMRAAAAALVAPCFLGGRPAGRAAVHPGDLRPREPASGVRPGRSDRRCRLRRAAPPGMGATKAALDALTLAAALAAPDPDAALVGVGTRRLRYGRALVDRARWLGDYLGEPAAAPRHGPRSSRTGRHPDGRDRDLGLVTRD